MPIDRGIARRAALAGGFAWAACFLAGCRVGREIGHRRVRNRIEQRVQAAMKDPQGVKNDQVPPGRLDDAHARWHILRALLAALSNHFWYPTQVDAEKFKAVADRLDQTEGRDLATVQGCLLILDLLEQASPTAKDYPWFATIHEEQSSGNILRLDRSKLP